MACLSDCATNVLRGNVPVTSKDKRTIGKHRRLARLLSSRRTPIEKKRTVVNQNGGFIGALLGPIVSILGGLLGGASS